MKGIKVKGKERGRPRAKPAEVIADSAYDTEEIRRGIKGNIPRNERRRINPKVGRPTKFEEWRGVLTGSSADLNVASEGLP